MKCKKCGSENVTVSTVAESRKVGCGTVILYIILAVSILGWFVLIPILLRKKTETKTYAVCQNCGYRWEVK